MKLLFILILSQLTTRTLGQHGTPNYKENINLTLKLLDSVNSLFDSSYKLILIDGDIYDDPRLQKFAEKKCMCCIVKVINLGFDCLPTSGKTIRIEIFSDPYVAEISDGDSLTIDQAGNILGTVLPTTFCQQWMFDRKTKSFRALK